MGCVQFTARERLIRIYDASGYYFQLKYDQVNFTAPINRKHTPETLVLDRGELNSDAGYRLGSDADRMEGLPITFSCELPRTKAHDLEKALQCNLTLLATTTKGTSQITNGRGVNTTTPTFCNSARKTVNVEYFAQQSGSTTVIYGKKYAEVEFAPDQIQLSEGGQDGTMMITANGMWYGAVSDLTAFTAGTLVASA